MLEWIDSSTTFFGAPDYSEYICNRKIEMELAIFNCHHLHYAEHSFQLWNIGKWILYLVSCYFHQFDPFHELFPSTFNFDVRFCHTAMRSNQMISSVSLFQCLIGTTIKANFYRKWFCCVLNMTRAHVTPAENWRSVFLSHFNENR